MSKRPNKPGPITTDLVTDPTLGAPGEAQKETTLQEVLASVYKIILAFETLFQHGHFKNVKSEQPVEQEDFDTVKSYLAAKH